MAQKLCRDAEARLDAALQKNSQGELIATKGVADESFSSETALSMEFAVTSRTRPRR
jgi:hypothetical protein